jgi:hypothetical protein
VHPSGQHRAAAGLRPDRTAVLQPDAAGVTRAAQETAPQGQEAAYPVHQQPQVRFPTCG